MVIRIAVTRVYDVDTGGGDTTDPESVSANIAYVADLGAAGIEQSGRLVLTHVGGADAEVVGPNDD
jgi:hypothetical protein